MNITEDDFSEEDIAAVIEQATNGTWSAAIPVDEYIEKTNPGYFERRTNGEQK